MIILAILQARMSSTRLPGKVMEPIEGIPMIGRQIERLLRARMIDELVVATSREASDDQLVAYVETLGLKVFRGSRDDVLERFIDVVNVCNPDVVVRLTADCPLVSPSVIDQVIEKFQNSDLDYLSNTLTPTYPDGLDVEVVSPGALVWVASNCDDPPEREHVTLGIYRRPDRFKVQNFSDTSDHSNLRWTVDTSADLEFVREIYNRLYKKNPEFEYQDVLDLLDDEQSLNRTSLDEVRNAALQGIDTGVMNA